MTGQVVIPLRARAPSGYSDTAALNDIHALLTTAEPAGGTLADIALILTRTGRPMARVRDIEVSAIETALGWPVACVDAGDTAVYVRQAPTGTGLLIEITTQTDAERGALVIRLDGEALHPPGPPAGEPA